LTFSQAISTCFRKYLSFQGRAPRSEYWWFVAFQAAVGFVLGIFKLELFSKELGNLLALVFKLVLLPPVIAVTVRRLHDVGLSGWCQLLGLLLIIAVLILYAQFGWWLFLPIIVVVVIVGTYLMCKPGDAQANQYGPAP
jgi:uncharacterized membrane protein YhaH (DUF805 family)